MTSSSFRHKDKTLFTPGPLSTSHAVKQAMLTDLGSRDLEFIGAVRAIRAKLLEVAGVSADDYAAVLMQGSGTFGVESVLSSTLAPSDKLAVIENGAYGRRIAHIAKVLGLSFETISFAEHEKPDVSQIEARLTASAATHVAMVHCETSTGMMNPIEAVGAVTARLGQTFFVDAMSSFGAVPIDFAKANIDFLVSSANKCIEGVPGFSFTIAQKASLQKAEGKARSVSLDLYAQYKGLESDGQFRFTPPTHALLAFRQALSELEQEGGVAGRAQRYQDNYNTLVEGMQKLGLREYLPRAYQGNVITAFYYPDSSNFNFETFYTRLSERGFVIYPGKVGDAQCFRIGNIGRIFREDMRALVLAIGEVLAQMGV